MLMIALLRNSNFDLNEARRTADLFCGTHDFRTFMGAVQQNSERDHAFFTMRRIDAISIEPAAAVTTTLAKQCAEQAYDYWNIEITGRSFLYRQVRRMVGVILATAQRKLRYRDAYEMLTIPSTNSWVPSASTAPAYGLYLLKVAYNEKDKHFAASQEEA